MVGVFLPYWGGRGCGGTLVSPRTVLTAARECARGLRQLPAQAGGGAALQRGGPAAKAGNVWWAEKARSCLLLLLHLPARPCLAAAASAACRRSSSRSCGLAMRITPARPSLMNTPTDCVTDNDPNNYVLLNGFKAYYKNWEEVGKGATWQRKAIQVGAGAGGRRGGGEAHAAPHAPNCPLASHSPSCPCHE